jgi:hypothetical protein
MIAVAAVGLLSLAGCDPRTLLFFLQPNGPTVAAPGPALQGKKVVIVAHAVGSAMTEFQALDRDVSREVISILREKVKKIDIVDPEKVSTWVEAHPSWTDPAELAKAFQADIVVFLEIETFQVQHPNDLNVYQGTAKTHIRVTEMVHPKNSRGKPITDQPKEAKELYDNYCDTEFPLRGPIPMDSGVSRGAFKNKFLKIVATEICWHFIDHAPDDAIQDVKFNNR